MIFPALPAYNMPDQFNQFVLITAFGEALPLAHHLLMEGKDVVVGMVDDVKDIGEKESEDSEAHKLRWAAYEGMMEKMTVQKAMAFLKGVKDEERDNWFVIFDFNVLWKYADEAKKMGFRNGLFPSKLDYVLESDRDLAKDFVLKYYPALKVAEVEQFKMAEEGIEFIKESDEFWALKGNDAGATTVVPRHTNIEFVKDALVQALQSDSDSYQRKGYILERQIRDGLEVCPQMIWYNGKRVAASIDLEDKNYSDDEDSEKYGCAINLIASIPMDCELVKIAFPPETDKLAAKHPGLFYLDCNMIMKDGENYYLEYCSGRMGYDAIFAECDMAGGVGNYFNALAHGVNPYIKKYGAGVRGFSRKREKDGMLRGGIPIRFDLHVVDHLWFFGAQKKAGQFVNTGGAFGDNCHGIDLLAFTEAANDWEYAVIKLYDVISNFSHDGMYKRSDFKPVIEPRIEGLEKFITSAVEEGGK